MGFCQARTGIWVVYCTAALLCLGSQPAYGHDSAVGVQETAAADLKENKIFEDVLERMMVNAIKQFDNKAVPFIPFIFNFQNISLCLTEVLLYGVSDIDVLSFTPGKPDGLIIPGMPGHIEVKFPSLVFESRTYIAGGYFMNLPFTGKSSMWAEFQGLQFRLEYDITALDLININYCLKPGSTKVTLSVDRAIVHFDDLNPGQDTGEMVNNMLSGFAKEIVDYIAKLLNDELHDLVDDALVGVINGLTCKEDANAKY